MTRSYIVLRLADGDWREHGPRQQARSAHAAIRQALDQEQSGTYVAIPARSFQPVTVTVQTQTVLKLQEA